jgi:hypothetical protein
MFCLPWKVCVFEEVPVDHDCALDSASHWIGGWFQKKLWQTNTTMEKYNF